MTATQKPTTIEEFNEFVRQVESQEGYIRPAAFALGWSRVSEGHDNTSPLKFLDADFSTINFGSNFGTAAVITHALGLHTLGTGTYPIGLYCEQILEYFTPFRSDGEAHSNIAALEEIMIRRISPYNKLAGHSFTPILSVVSSLGDIPKTVGDTYLRLLLLSTRKVKPNGVNLDGIFGILNNVVWTDHGPIDPDLFPAIRQDIRSCGGHIHVYAVDKIPQLADYVPEIPSGVRIANGSRVRLGAHLGEGTTVMPEGFVNFNAGTMGPNMVEGRISHGVFVGSNSDIGGGASTMGTLSGGGTEVIQVGEGCLIGANAGIGISLGDGCIVEAGLYVTAGTPVTVIGDTGSEETVVARTLSGKSNLLFRRNGVNGRVEVLPNNAKWSGLNDILHNN